METTTHEVGTTVHVDPTTLLTDRNIRDATSEPHTPGRGCTYASLCGSWVNDRHTDGGADEHHQAPPAQDVPQGPKR